MRHGCLKEYTWPSFKKKAGINVTLNVTSQIMLYLIESHSKVISHLTYLSMGFCFPTSDIDLHVRLDDGTCLWCNNEIATWWSYVCSVKTDKHASSKHIICDVRFLLELCDWTSNRHRIKHLPGDLCSTASQPKQHPQSVTRYPKTAPPVQVWANSWPPSCTNQAWTDSHLIRKAMKTTAFWSSACKCLGIVKAVDSDRRIVEGKPTQFTKSKLFYLWATRSPVQTASNSAV